MPIHNLKEYSNNYSGTTRSLWQYDEDEPKDPITDSYLFKLKQDSQLMPIIAIL